jgi:hypothetical protein
MARAINEAIRVHGTMTGRRCHSRGRSRLPGHRHLLNEPDASRERKEREAQSNER